MKKQINQKKINGFLLIALLFFSLLFACKNGEKELVLDQDQGLEEAKIPNDWFFQQRAYPFPTIDKTAFAQAQRVRKTLVANKKNQVFSRYNDDWIFGGPNNIGGRVTDVEMLASSTETIYVGTASGGIFKSTNSGEAWLPIFDDAPSLSIGDMAIAPSDDNIIYVGTGEANGGGGSIAYDGLGVYKSVDAGATWAAAGLENVGSIGKIIVDSINPNRVFVAAMGDLFGETNDKGVYRSLDGGANWEQVLFTSSKTGAIDLAYHPSKPNVIYAALWERTRTPVNNTYGGESSGIYRSTDGGDTWEELTSGLPSIGSQKGRIGLAIAPSDAQQIYAFYARADGEVQGIYSSPNGGDDWALKNSSGIQSVPYMWWFGKIYVHPTEKETLYLAGFRTHRSLDGGDNWNNVFQGVHVDQHAVFVHPGNPDLVLLGNDGGLYLSFDRGANSIKLNNLPITQFYTCEIDASFPERLYGGTQDNSSMRTLNGNTDGWEIIYVGDGFYTLVDPLDNSFVYTEYQYGNFAKSIDGGNTFSSAMSGISGGDRANWNTPVVFDPNDPNTLYYGANRLYQSLDRAEFWTAISPDLSNGPGGGSQTYGTITTINVSPVDSKIIYVGTDDGNVWVSKDKGVNWDKISDALPNRWVTSVVADPLDVNKAYVTISGYRHHSDMVHVYKTDDQGDNWTAIAGDLPDVPVNDILVLATEELVLATDIGVFYSINDGENWELLGQGLPNVVITDLDYHEPTLTLVAATFGRSMFKYVFSPPVSIAEVAIAKPSLEVYPNPSIGDAILQMETASASEYTITLYDSQGKMIRSIFQGNWEANRREFSLKAEGLAAGLYLLRVESGSERYVVKWLKSGS